MRALIGFLAIVMAAGPVLAAPAWTVDKAASRVGFVSSMNGEAFEGAFGRYDAKIAFDPKDLKSSKVVVAIDVTSAVTGDQTRDESLPTKDWFWADKFPRATFISTGFTDLGGGRYQAAGNLTLREISRPIVLPFTLAISGDTAKMTSAIVVNRLVFGIGQGQWKTEEAIPARVTVRISLTTKKAR